MWLKCFNKTRLFAWNENHKNIYSLPNLTFCTQDLAAFSLTLTKIIAGLSRMCAWVITMSNLIPRAFHVHPFFGEKGNGNGVQFVKFLLQVEIRKNPKNPSFIPQTLNVKFIFNTRKLAHLIQWQRRKLRSLTESTWQLNQVHPGVGPLTSPGDLPLGSLRCLRLPCNHDLKFKRRMSNLFSS